MFATRPLPILALLILTLLRTSIASIRDGRRMNRCPYGEQFVASTCRLGVGSREFDLVCTQLGAASNDVTVSNTYISHCFFWEFCESMLRPDESSNAVTAYCFAQDIVAGLAVQEGDQSGQGKVGSAWVA